MKRKPVTVPPDSRSEPIFLALTLCGASYSQTGSISASPNPCSIADGQSVCTTFITWSSQGVTDVQVWVSLNGAPESAFASSGSGGPYSQDAPWISVPPNSFSFRLYNYSGGSRGALLASVTVTATSPPATGSISANPNPCSISAGQSACTALVSWSSQGVSDVQIWVSMNGAPETAFASSAVGGTFSQQAPWIQGPPNSYIFRLYNYSGGSRGALLAQITVTGVVLVSCDGITTNPPYLGNVGLVATFFTVQVQNVPTGVTSVRLLARHENQSIAQSIVYTANQQSGTTTWSAVVSTASTLGSYAVTPQLVPGSGTPVNCLQKSAFYSVIDVSALPPSPPHITCNSLAGNWADQFGGNFTLSQSGANVTGSAVIPLYSTTTGAFCANGTYSVSGTRATSGVFNFTAVLQSVPLACTPAITPLEIQSVNITNATCSAASGMETDYLMGQVHAGPYPLNLTSSVAIPSGEQSQAIGWGLAGFTAWHRFRGQLAIPSNGLQFGGRRVRETTTTVNDGCYDGLPANIKNFVERIVPSDLDGLWEVQATSAYFEDAIGYGPGFARFYQVYYPGGTCALTTTQSMQINLGGTGWQTYKNNSVVISVMPSSIAVQRDNVSASKPYPAVSN